ncbi:MAG TPA: DUF6519 domain-containing protein [Polyangia bacterium]|nr:DUF6519 domain-containing protein [Polyangia bacterium]
MKSDKSRETFVPTKHYSSVRLQQGRVLTDADWNEQSDIIEHRDETTSLDVIGPSGAPVGNPGFTIVNVAPFTGVADLSISAGRMYVDGILCELEEPTLYATQPDPVYDTNLNTPPTIPTGFVLAYLDVWERHIGVVEDPQIREVALGGPDTATRAKTVWQVKTALIDVANDPTATAASTLAGLQPANPGALAARAQPTDAATDPCIIPQAAGFRSLENQLYRVEVHVPGSLQPAHDGSNGAFPPVGPPPPTFKWSRDNGSVVAAWIEDPQPLPNTLKVQLLTNDPTRGFSVGDWVELSDDRLDLSGFGGTFLQLTKVEGDVLTYSTDPAKIIGFPGLPAPTPINRPDDSFHPKVRRWDMPPTSTGPQPIILNASDPTTDPDGAFIDLENGVQVQFEVGDYQTGDYWTIPARTATNDVEWPPMTSAPDSPPAQLPAFGIKHHLACLATFNLTSGGFQGVPDTSCRPVFSPLTDLNPVTPNNLPQPGEWRYYLVDVSGTVGSDENGKVGISNMSPEAAYANAIPFKTLNAALATFSRDGNDSTAVIMLTPSTAPDPSTPPKLYDDLILNGLHGYQKVLIRCSQFIDANNQKIATLDDIDPSDWSVLGATSKGPFSPSGQVVSPAGGNVINVSQSTQIGAADDALVGQRLRFLPGPNSQMDGFSTMVLGNKTVNGLESVTIGDPLQSNPGAPEQFVFENPSAPFGAVFISGAGGPLVGVFRDDEPFNPIPSLTLAGLQIQNLVLAGPIVAEVAFCQVTASLQAAPSSVLILSNFGRLKITPDYVNELGNTQQVGVGVNVDDIIDVENGDQLTLHNCAGVSSQFEDVDDLDIQQGFFSQTTVVQDCKRFSIGVEAPTGSPRLVRIGANLAPPPPPTPSSPPQSITALAITDSDGDVLGTLFDIQASSNEFDFNPAPNDGVNLSAIQLTGTGRSLRIRDVDLGPITDNNGGFASGVLLDASGAVSSIIDYDQRLGTGTGTTIASGLITLPGRTFFRPIELAYTDFRDPADNHFLSPGVSSAQTSGGALTLSSFNGRSFVGRGISVQSKFALDRFSVVEYTRDGTSRVQGANINLGSIGGDPNQAAAAIGASIAGIMQTQILSAESNLAFGTVIASGYSLVALSSNADVSSLPAALYCDGSTATTVRPVDTGSAVVQIGVLVRVVATGGLGGNAVNQVTGRFGLARIHIDPNGVPGAGA